jgi:hypothetical protein
MKFQSVRKSERSIDVTPHWPGMFRMAVQLCRDGLEKGEGRELVIEMLEFGARLEAARSQAGTKETIDG